MIEIEITDRNGNRYGDGPIITAESWEHTTVLDGAGSGQFSLPAGDWRAGLAQQRRYARAYGYVDGVRTLLDELIITSREIRTRPDGMAALTIAGDDLLAELANRTVGELSLHRDIVSRPLSVHRLRDFLLQTDIMTECHDGDLDTYFEFSWPRLDVDQFIYVVGEEQFDMIRLVMSQYNHQPANLVAQYYTEFPSPAWNDFDLDDQTAVDGTTLRRNGDLVLDGGVDWVETTLPIVGLGDVTGYWARVYVQSDAPLTSGIRWHEVQLIQRVGTQDALRQIMAYAPAGWTLNPAWHTKTSAEVLMTFAGESVLEALIEVAAKTGDHFHRATGRSVIWAWADDLEDSGLRAVHVEDYVAAERNDAICVLQNLAMTTSSVELVTRLYPQGADGLTLADTTRTNDDLPIGYQLSTAQNYVENRARIDALGGNAAGLIERWWQKREISAASTSLASRQAAADALLDAALEELRVRSADVQACRVEVVKLVRTLDLGQTIQLVYHEWRDGYHAVDIDDHYYVLGITMRYDANGVRVVGLDLATVDRWVVGVNLGGGPALVLDLAKQLRHLMATSAGITNATNSQISNYLSGLGGEVRAGLVEVRDKQNDPILRASHDDQTVSIGPAARRGWMYDGDQHYATPDVLGAEHKVGFFGATPIGRVTVTGSKAGNAALTSLLSALEQFGLIVDDTE